MTLLTGAQYLTKYQWGQCCCRVLPVLCLEHWSTVWLSSLDLLHNSLETKYQGDHCSRWTLDIIIFVNFYPNWFFDHIFIVSIKSPGTISCKTFLHQGYFIHFLTNDKVPSILFPLSEKLLNEVHFTSPMLMFQPFFMEQSHGSRILH